MAFAKAVSICLEAWSLSSDLLHRSIYKRKPFVLFLVQVGIDKKGDRPPKNEAMVCQEQHKPLLTSRLTIMVLVAVMLVLTTLLTWYYTSLYSRHAVRSLTSILRSHVLKTSLQTISCALGQVHNISLALRSLHQQIIVKNSNASWPYVQDQICQSNWAIITSQPQLISAAFISEDSYSTGYTRVDDSIDLFFTNRATNASSPPSWYMQITFWIWDWTTSGDDLGALPVQLS